MLIGVKNLINLPVYTKSQDFLGKIKEIDLDIDTQTVAKYYVKNNKLMKGLVAGELIIKPSQVISIDKRQMVVDDGLIDERQAGLAKETAAV